MPNAFFIRPKVIAGSALVLFVFLFDFSGKQTGADEQTIRRLRADFNRAIAARDVGALPKFWREDCTSQPAPGGSCQGATRCVRLLKRSLPMRLSSLTPAHRVRSN